MYLKYIDLQGFKSFPDKTRIELEPGFTCIVGPNGSGKSNVSDAIRWVLGEQSTKSLRGEKMEDVIFGGTQLRKPMGFSQVTLTLDNADRRLGDFAEIVTVGRRYYRSGESEYLLNGNAVRLKDVRETFLDTGLSRDGYSVVEQGRIAEIVSAKSTDRREIFEEASGIAKYRYRKNEASRKLEAAQGNLERLRDILDELESRVGPLQKQSEDAEEFLRLSNEKKGREITLYCDTVSRSRAAVKEQDEKVEIAKRDYESVDKELEEMTQLEERDYDESREISAESERHNSEILSVSEHIAIIERSAAVLETDLRHGETQLLGYKNDRENASGAAGGIEKEIEERRAMSAATGLVLFELDDEIRKTEKELLDLVAEGEKTAGERANAAERLAALSNEATDMKVGAMSASATKDTLAERIEVLKKNLPLLTQRLNESAKERDELGKELETTNGEIEDCENRKRGFEQKLEARRARLAEAKTALEKSNYDIENLTHRISALEDLEKSMDGFSLSVKKVVEASRERELRGIVGTVASLISIEKGCELAIETALGAAMQNIVVLDERAAKDAINYLKNTRAGRATFLPLDTIKPSRFDGNDALNMSGAVGLASSLVKADNKYESIVSSLLGRTVVANDLDAATGIAKKLSYRYRVVTLDGQVINSGGSYTGGFTSRSAGVFSRRNEIEKLVSQRESAKKTAEEAKNEYDKIKLQESELAAQVTVFSSELVNLAGDKIRVETELKRVEMEFSVHESAEKSASQELDEATRRLEDAREQEKQSAQRLESIAAEIKRLETAGDEGSEFEELTKRRNEITERLSAAKVRRMEKQKDLETIEAVVEQLRRRSELERSRGGDIDEAIASLEILCGKQRSEIEEKRNEAAALREKIDGLRAQIAKCAEKRTELERAMTEKREKQNAATKRREDIGREISRLEERRISLQKDFDSSIAKLWEDYELTPAEAAAQCVEYSSITALRQEVASLRSKIKALGTVNVAAIEEYKEVRERYDFMTEQVGDVEKSKTELTNLIESLTGEMKTIFEKSFAQINAQFRRVFVEMFGGGSAELSLENPDDILESGIDISAQPPGKLIKNLTALSGGEQSLVAIAIYFAILSVNPAPFCVLDEIDSALDDVNVTRYASYLRRAMTDTQFIAITHRRGTMEAADTLYGVSMQEEGVSKLLRLTEDEAFRIATK